ncbi:PIN domain-containing protein [bacterium]|nr:PIN domain-containing protein [bacterium]
MKKSKEIRKTKVFLDSSVVIAAVLSFSGSSFALIRNSLFKNYQLFLLEYVLEECFRVLYIKYPTKLPILIAFLTAFPFQIAKDPSQKEVEKVIDIINPEDAPILAGAIKYQAKYLITLDKKDFLVQKVIGFAEKHKISVITPKEFLSKFN